MRYAILFYQAWDCPTILEMVSKCIYIMTSDLEGHEQTLCYRCIKDIVQVTIDILNAGVENSSDNVIYIFIYINMY